ncbi:MAG: hypothetical protein KDA85_03220, partial [Planctomycetaceae bacterium]|nr:hypothetical protein [Planctomycetaceae bacterium]
MRCPTLAGLTADRHCKWVLSDGKHFAAQLRPAIECQCRFTATLTDMASSNGNVKSLISQYAAICSPDGENPARQAGSTG